MSHYTVTIILPDVPKNAKHVEEMLEPLLAPYNEELEVEPYKDYCRPVVENWRTAADRELAWPYSVVRENAPELDLSDYAAVATFMNKRYADDGGEREYGADEDGLFQWSTYNPLSKWDWWVLGGRWAGFYTLLDGCTGYTGTPGVFGNDPGTGYDAARKGDILVEDHRVQTYAVLAEGVWRSPGRMGWFGVSTETDDQQAEYEKWFQEFWQDLGDDVWLAVVDVHI